MKSLRKIFSVISYVIASGKILDLSLNTLCLVLFRLKKLHCRNYTYK